MGSILMLVGLFSMVLTSGRTTEEAPTEAEEWGEKEDVWLWNVEDYPNPQRTPQYCRRYAASNVCDPDGILTKDQADNVDSAIRRLYNDTPCLCPECSTTSGGIIIGIAVMKRIFVPYNERDTVVIQEFADELRRRWTLGRCENEIVIVLATGDRMSSTSVGPGISSYISPEESRIFHENKRHFTVGNYYKGLLSMIQAYYDLSRSIKVEKEIEQLNIGLVLGIVFGVVMLIVLIILVGCTLRRRMSRPEEPYRKDSGSGYPSQSWTMKQYQDYNTREVKGKTSVAKRADAGNNNDQDISTGVKERIANKADETAGPYQTLLTTLAESENEDDTRAKGESEGDREIPIANVNGKNELELPHAETKVSPPAPGAAYRGTVTNL